MEAVASKSLTGACVIGLGHVTSGLLANDDQLAGELVQCGDESGDRVWRLPMFDEYQDQLKSNFADMSNLGGRPAGTITAACFLARFARAYKWAHLDIAGTNAVSGDARERPAGRCRCCPSSSSAGRAAPGARRPEQARSASAIS